MPSSQPADPAAALNIRQGECAPRYGPTRLYQLFRDGFPQPLRRLGGDLGFRFWSIASPARKASADVIVLYHRVAMSPDRRPRRRQSARQRAAPQVRTRPSSDDAHEVVFFRRHRDDDPEQAIPGRQFLNACPIKVRATMRAVLAQVAAAPPKRFAGGRYWEAMKGNMTGWFEVRVDDPRRTLHLPPLDRSKYVTA